MGLFKSKVEKLKREDVVNAICELENKLSTIEKNITAREANIAELMKKGRTEKSRELRLFLAKRIAQLKEEKESEAKRGMYLLYNIKLMNQLKEAIDDKDFVSITAKMSLGDLLGDQKGLAKFLNKALNTKVKQEDVLTQADEIFQDVKLGYEANESIYGSSNNDDALLAMFEEGEQADMENSLFSGEEEVIDIKE